MKKRCVAFDVIKACRLVGADAGQDSFTMHAMLDMLHVDYDTIGYDKKQQRWIT